MIAQYITQSTNQTHNKSNTCHLWIQIEILYYARRGRRHFTGSRGWRGIVIVVDWRLAVFHAGPSPRTFVSRRIASTLARYRSLSTKRQQLPKDKSRKQTVHQLRQPIYYLCFEKTRTGHSGAARGRPLSRLHHSCQTSESIHDQVYWKTNQVVSERSRGPAKSSHWNSSLRVVCFAR